MNFAKTELRRALKKARLALSPQERQAKSAAISARLWQALDWTTVANLHCYEPIEHLGEVDITDFITALQTDYPKIQLSSSKQIGNDWKVVSITDGQSTSDTKFDVIIVPMLGFDKSLHRIGYGGGYYDKLLATQPDAKKIGVCFEQGKLNHLSIEPHDIPLDSILTEARVY